MLAIGAPVAQAEEMSDTDRIKRGLELFFEGLQGEMGNQLSELEGLADEARPALRDFLLRMGPALGALMDQVEDWNRYQMPEILPNGDIIIRRKPEPDALPGPDGAEDPNAIDI